MLYWGGTCRQVDCREQGSGADPGSWQSACRWCSHKPGGRLPLLSSRSAVILQPLRGCYQIWCFVNRGTMGVNSLPKTALRLWFEPGPFCAWVQHANHSATKPPERTVVNSISPLEAERMHCGQGHSGTRSSVPKMQFLEVELYFNDAGGFHART